MVRESPVLVVAQGWIGDLAMASSLFRVLRADRPERPVDVIAPPWGAALLGRMPEVRRHIALVVGHGELGLMEQWRVGRRLRNEGYGQAIVLPRSIKSALVPWIAGIPRRTGYLGEHRRFLLNDIRPALADGASTVLRFAALGCAPGAVALSDRPDASGCVQECAGTPGEAMVPRPTLCADPAAARAVASSLGLVLDSPVLALCPGAEYGPAKRWPPHHFAELAVRQLARGWQVWLLGGAADRPLTRSIQQDARGAIDLAGRTSLDMAVDLLSLAHAVVANDSGLLHVAAALDRPVVGLYGSSGPGVTPPRATHARVLSLGLSCSPCFQRTCPLGHTDCLVKLLPDQVDAALMEFAITAS